MPELPEVETTVRGLARFLEGERIERVVLNRPDLRRPFPPDLVQALTGARVTSLGRRAKYGLIHTDRARTVIFHLGMSGRWRIDPDERGETKWRREERSGAGRERGSRGGRSGDGRAETELEVDRPCRREGGDAGERRGSDG